LGGQHGGWGVGGPGGVGVYHGGSHSQSQDQVESMMNDFATLTIDQTDRTVRVRNYSSQLVAQYPMSADNSNDKDAKNNTSDWQAGQLVVVTQSKSGGKITRRYTLSADGEQLFVTTRIDKKGSDPPVLFRFVYDPLRNNAQDQ
jgi:preprotein translocase subunit SecD